MHQEAIAPEEVDQLATLAVRVARENGAQWPSLWGNTREAEIAAFGVAMVRAVRDEANARAAG